MPEGTGGPVGAGTGLGMEGRAPGAGGRGGLLLLLLLLGQARGQVVRERVTLTIAGKKVNCPLSV